MKTSIFTLNDPGIARIIIVYTMVIAGFAGCKPEFIIDNPYEKVNWENYGRYKSDLHSHTSHSDGNFSPHAIVDLYHKKGYDILAIADHNRVSYPWQKFSSLEPSVMMIRRLESGGLEGISHEEFFKYENRNPDSLGMIAFPANEISQHHHLGSYFNLYEDRDRIPSTVEESLDSIGEYNGLAVLFHPGRHGAEESVPTEWYFDMFKNYDHLIGLEAYNSGLRGHQPGSIQKWDSILKHFMPDRPVWGFSNDDFHNFSMSVLGRNFNIFLLPELSVQEVRKSMENGSFYFVAREEGYYNGPHPPDPPEIRSIEVNPRKGTIHIEATNYQFIEWISDGNVIHVGDYINLSDIPDIGKYIRANIYQEKDGALAGTQPFGIRRR